MNDLEIAIAILDGSEEVEIPWNLYSKGFDIIWMKCTKQHKY